MQRKQAIVKITDQTYLQMLKEMLIWYPKETGGVLMGYKKEKEIGITHIIGPGPDAIHELYSFTPDNDYHEKEIARVYSSTGKDISYIGDWHTHPNNAAYLSSRDKRTLKNIASYKPSRLPEPLMIVLGTFPFEVKGWILKKGGLNNFKYVPAAIEFLPDLISE